MKLKSLSTLITIITGTTLSLIVNCEIAQGQTFGEQKIERGSVVPVAVPFGANRHNLLLIEQQSNERDCWEERGSNPVIIEPLLLDFDFTGICGRATDSNGYSIRLGNRDLGWNYALRIVQQNNDLLLVGKPVDGSQSEIVIGRSNGLRNGYKKIILEPGWEISKRTYNGQLLGHYYLSTDNSPLRNTTASRPTSSSSTSNASSSGSSQETVSQEQTQLHDFVDLLCENFNDLPGCRN
ncbi:DUF3747 domain-containing protein [Dactylococcopsis salina]|uniref:DUF3747 domain-containing protein n=1 Tax=Dactylococcopsis salina (strain PCC 8305) TaxID=13035 RepID=K9YZT6_DACS8|nr:DUF3747 domain-containing protein [Dactylococcopsis salina]AFZ51820.1 Protein of unknown function (DUF3747) [Dactylococcopsis salina PCC 8305]